MILQINYYNYYNTFNVFTGLQWHNILCYTGKSKTQCVINM